MEDRERDLWWIIIRINTYELVAELPDDSTVQATESRAFIRSVSE